MFNSISQAIAESALREQVLWALMNVPGLPPILQTIHILCIAALIGTVAFTQLRILNIAIPSQDPQRLLMRYTPWAIRAFLLAFLSGVVFVIARPYRYFSNPIAGFKAVFVLLAISATLALYIMARVRDNFWADGKTTLWITRILSLAGLLGWLGAIFAGRWIAYVDYLFWE